MDGLKRQMSTLRIPGRLSVTVIESREIQQEMNGGGFVSGKKTLFSTASVQNRSVLCVSHHANRWLRLELENKRLTIVILRTSVRPGLVDSWLETSGEHQIPMHARVKTDPTERERELRDQTLAHLCFAELRSL